VLRHDFGVDASSPLVGLFCINLHDGILSSLIYVPVAWANLHDFVRLQ
jgi:hypothetical protein